MSDLPPGWEKVPLGEVATTQLGRMLSARRETGVHSKPYLRNRDVQWHYINTDELPVMDFSPKDSARFILQSGDVLVCEGGEVGRAAIWNGQLTECYYQKALHRVRTAPELLPKFLVYLLEYYSRTRQFEQYVSGSTIAHLPQEDLRELPIPLPPVVEQGQIIDALEEQLSCLEAGGAATQSASEKLTSLGSAILSEAIKSSPETSFRHAGELFKWASGKRISSPANTLGAIPVYGGNGVAGYTTEPLVLEATIVVGRVGAYCGNVNLTNGPAWVTDNAIYAKSHSPDILPEFAALVFHSAQLRNRAAGSGQPFVSQKVLNEIAVPCISIARQAEISARYNEAEEALSRIEHQIETLGRRQELLRTSILSATFAGKLVTWKDVA